MLGLMEASDAPAFLEMGIAEAYGACWRAVWANGPRSQHTDERDDALRWYAA